MTFVERQQLRGLASEEELTDVRRPSRKNPSNTAFPRRQKAGFPQKQNFNTSGPSGVLTRALPLRTRPRLTHSYF